MQQYQEAEKDYVSGMKYKDIAEKYGVTLDTVKSWKKRYGWIRPGKSGNSRDEKSVCTQKKGAKTKKVCTQNEPPPETFSEDELNEKQRMFCVFYAKSHNATKAYQRAYGCDYYSAAVGASRLLKNINVQNELKTLRELVLEKVMLTEQDIVQKYVDIAFADMNDFVELKDELWKVREGIDGTAVRNVKNGKYGAEVQLNDRMRALEHLEKYMKEQKAMEPDENDDTGTIEIVKRLKLEEPDEAGNMDATAETGGLHGTPGV